MKESAFLPLGRADEFAGPGPYSACVDGVDLAVVRVSGQCIAFEGRCPHRGMLLGEGEIDGDHLVCRNHRWRFALPDGKRQGGPERLSSYPVVERNGELFVDLSQAKQRAKGSSTRTMKDLPGPKPLPIIGNMHQLDLTRFHSITEQWAATYGPLYKMRIGPTEVLAVSDPETVDEVLRARPQTFRRHAKVAAIIAELKIDGVFNAEGAAWRPQRKLAVEALAQRRLKNFYPHIDLVARRLVARWRRLAAEGAILDIAEELKRFTVDVTLLVTFGHDVNTLEQDDDVIQEHLGVVFPTLMKRGFALFPLWRYIKLPADRKVDEAIEAVRSWLAQLLEDARRRAKTESASSATNFLEAMVAATDEDGRPFSNEVVMANLLTMVLAGEDNTAHTLAWAIHEVLLQPQWADAIRAEADQAFGPSETATKYEACAKLAAAAAVANEAMRLRPVAPVIMLDANHDTVVADVSIPAGTTVAVLVRPAAMSDAHFAEAAKFRPQRWLEPSAGPHDLGTFLPFGSGPRLCPGRSLALVEMNAALALLYKNFDVERVGAPEDVKEVAGFTMTPGGLRVRLHERKGK